MGSISTFAKLALGYEDTFGKVLAGSTGRSLWKESKFALLPDENGVKKLTKVTGRKRFANFVENANTEVLRFDKKMSLANDIFDKGTLNVIRKAKGANNKQFYNKLIDLVESNPTKNQISEFLEKNGVSSVKQSRSLFKKIAGFFTGAKAETLTADKIATNAFDKLSKAAVESTDDVLKSTIKSGKGLGGIFKSLKGKGGTLGILLSVGFEAIEIVKAAKNGDGAQQVGRSTFNIAGFAGGAAAGAAIGSIIPIAGTGIGALIGGICGFVGGMAGGALAGKAGEALFGKSIADKKAEAEEKQMKELEKQKTTSGLDRVG